MAPPEIFFQTHGLFFERSAAVRVVIKEGVRLRHRHAVEELVMPFGGRPVAVRGLVLGHQHEGLVLILAVLEPFQRFFRDDVRNIAIDTLGGAIHLNEVRIVVIPLVRENFPVIEAGGLADKVPFADDGGFITRLREVFGKGRLSAIESRIVVIDETIDVRMLAREDAGARRTTDGIRAIRTVEDRALLGKAVDIGRGGDVLESTAIRGNRL